MPLGYKFYKLNAHNDLIEDEEQNMAHYTNGLRLLNPNPYMVLTYIRLVMYITEHVRFGVNRNNLLVE